MRRLASLVCAVPCWRCSGLPEGGPYAQTGRAASFWTGQTKPIRLAYLYSDGNLPGTLKAFKALLQERPDLRGKVELTFLTESVLPDVKLDEVKKTDVLLLDTMNQQMLDRFNTEHKIDLIAMVRDRPGRVFAIGEGLLPKETYIKQGALWDEKARAYWAHMGFSNQVGLMKYALTLAGIKGLVLPAPQRSLDFGYYYPALAGPKGPALQRDPGPAPPGYR